MKTGEREVSVPVNGDPDGLSADHAGESLLGGDLRVRRLGFGAMRISGKGISKEPQAGVRRFEYSGERSNSGSTSLTRLIPMAPK